MKGTAADSVLAVAAIAHAEPRGNLAELVGQTVVDLRRIVSTPDPHAAVLATFGINVVEDRPGLLHGHLGVRQLERATAALAFDDRSGIAEFQDDMASRARSLARFRLGITTYGERNGDPRGASYGHRSATFWV